MTRAGRIAGWILAAAMAVAPSLASAAQACASCCCPPAPCHEGPGDCGASVAAMPCGGGTAAAVPAVAKRTPEPPFQAALPIAWQIVAGGGGVAGPARAGDPAVHVSALRLSVVLRL